MVTGNAGYARLQAFGVVFGCERVVIYVEPENGKSQEVTANTARSHLMIENEPLQWSAYAGEFRQNMPDELAAYMDEIGLSARHSDHRQAIRERLNSIKDLFRFGRYRPKPSGSYRIPEDHDNAGGSAGLDTQREKEGKSGGSGGQGGRKGDVYALFTDEGGVPRKGSTSPLNLR